MSETGVSKNTHGNSERQSSGMALLIQNVRADPDLSPAERETAIHWCAEDGEARVYSEERGIILSILRSPVATIHTIRVSSDDEFGGTIPPEQYQDGAVTGVEATVPIGAIKVKSNSRSSEKRSLVVSDHQPGDSA